MNGYNESLHTRFDRPGNQGSGKSRDSPRWEVLSLTVAEEGLEARSGSSLSS